MQIFQQVIDLSKLTHKTVMQAAESLGITKQAVSVWAAKPGAPVELVAGKMRLRWPEFPRWREQQLKAKDKPADFDEAKTREMAARAEMAELELAEKRGELAKKTTVVKATGRFVERLDAKVRGMVPVAAARLWGAKSPQDLQARMAALVEEVRAELRDFSPGGTE